MNSDYSRNAGRLDGGRRSFASLLVTIILASCVSAPSPAPSSDGSLGTPTTSAGAATPAASVTPTATSPGIAPERLTYHQAGQVVPLPDGQPVPSVRLFDTGIQSNEPSIAVLPDGSFAYQGWDRPATESVGTWQVFVGPPEGAWRDISPAPALPTHDPYLAVDPVTGRIFSANLLLPGELDPELFCVVVSSTDDQGVTWTSSEPVCDVDADRPRLITSAPITSITTEDPNLVYMCYFHSEADGQACHRSLDGGRTFLPAGSIPPDGCDSGVAGALFGHLATDAKGALYLARMSCRRPVVAISRDEGSTWDQHVVGPPGWNGYGEMAVAVDQDGVIYALWISGDRLPYLAVSTDEGMTWTNPRSVAAPGVTEANLPVIEVGAGGRLAMGAIQSTDAPAGIKPTLAVSCPRAPCRDAPGYDAVTWHAGLTVTDNALEQDPLFISAILNDPTRPIIRGSCGPGRCKTNGDFIDLVIDASGSPWLAFVACAEGECPQTTARAGWGSSPGMLGTIDGVPLR